MIDKALSDQIVKTASARSGDERRQREAVRAALEDAYAREASDQLRTERLEELERKTEVYFSALIESGAATEDDIVKGYLSSLDKAREDAWMQAGKPARICIGAAIAFAILSVFAAIVVANARITAAFVCLLLAAASVLAAYLLSRKANAAGDAAFAAARDDSVELWIMERRDPSSLPRWFGDRLPEGVRQRQELEAQEIEPQEPEAQEG